MTARELIKSENAAASASLRILTYLGRGRIGVRGEIGVVGLAADVADRKHQVFGKLAFHRQVPYLDSGREHVRIETGGLIDRAGCRYPWAARRRQRNILLQRKDRKESVPYQRNQRLACRVRWIGLDPDAEVIHQIVVDAKGSPHRPGSRACRVPGQAYARLQQQFGVILVHTGSSNNGIGLDRKAGVVPVVRAPARHLVESVGHLVPQPQAQAEIRPQLHVVLDIPGAFRGAEAQRARIPRHDSVVRLIPEKCQYVRIGDVSR